MPDLGDLYFNIMLRDNTAQQKQQIKQQLLNDLHAELDVKLKNTSSLRRDIEAALKANAFTATINGVVSVAQLQSQINNTQFNAHISAIAAELVESINKAVKSTNAQVPLSIDASALQSLINNVLTSKGYKVGVGINATTLKTELETALKNGTHKVEVQIDTNKLVAQLQSVFNKYASVNVEVNKSAIRNELQQTLQQSPFKINIVVDKASATQAVQQALAGMGAWNGKYSPDDLRAEKARTEQEKQRYKQAQSELVKLRAAHIKAGEAADRHSGASIRLHGALGSNISVAGQLKDQFISLYSVYAAEKFLSKVIDIGGELEHQKLALDAILKDKGKTQDLFGEIRSLALKSPFGVLDLNQYAKQLSAFTVPYNELYDTMKRLADISAGTGVDMSRLILAYGKTKNRTFLDGLEAKQFAYANIPIYDSLSKKLTELEGKFVSVADVMKRISKKQISFQMVKDVLWGLTDEGGMFNNMQEVLSSSVKTRWKLVKDALDLMYGDLAESLATPLKGVADVLIALTKHWKDVAAVMAVAVTAYTAQRLASALLTKGVLAETSAVYKNLLADKQSEAEKLRMAGVYRTLTAEERRKIATSTRLTQADLNQLVAASALTKEQALQLIAMKKLTLGQAQHLVSLGLISQAEVKTAASTTRLRVAMMNASNAIKRTWASLSSMFLNPQTAIFAAIGVAVEMFMRYKQKTEEAKEATDALHQKANEAYKNLSNSLKSYSLDDLPSMTREQMRSAMDEMVQTLKDYHLDFGSVFEDAFGNNGGVKSLQEQYKILRQAILDVAEAQKIVARNASLPGDANDATDGTFDDSLTENINDYSRIVSRLKKEQTSLLQDTIKLERVFSTIANYDSVFAKQISEGSMTAVQKLDLLMKRYQEFMKNGHVLSGVTDAVRYYDSVRSTFRDYANYSNKASKEMGKVLEDAETWVKVVKGTLSQQGFDFANGLTKAQEQAVRSLVKSLVDSAKEASPEVRAEIEKELLKKFNISVAVNFTGDTQSIEYWKERLKKNLKGKFDTTITAAADYTSVIDAVRKQYKTAREESRKLGPVLLKAGIKFTTGKKIDTKQFDVVSAEGLRKRELAEQYNEYVDLIDAAVVGSTSEGFSLLAEKQQDRANAQAESEFAKKLKERLSLIKSAYTEYKNFAELIGSDAAIQKLRESNVFGALFADENFDVTNLKGNIEDVVKSAKKALKDTAAQTVARQGEEELLKIDYDKLKDSLDKSKKEIEQFVSTTTGKWELYKELLEKTGSETYSKLAFNVGHAWDKASSIMHSKLQEMMNKGGIGDQIINWDMDEAKAKEFFKQNTAMLTLYLAIQKATSELAKSMLTEGANAINKRMTAEEQIKLLEKEKQDIKDLYKTNPSLIPEGEAARIAEIDDQIAQLKSDLFALSPLYQQIFGSMQYQNWGAVDKAEKVARELVENAQGVNIKNGKPTTYKTFYLDGDEKKEITLSESLLKKLKDTIDGFYDTKLSKNPFRTLADGLKKLQEAAKNNTKLEAKDWQQLSSSLASCINQITGVTSALQDMFEALGDESTAEAMETLNQVASGIANIAQGFSQDVFTGVVASITTAISLVTSIINSAKKAREEIIKESERRITQIENLKSDIERMLGYSLKDYSTISVDISGDESMKKYYTDLMNVAYALGAFKTAMAAYEKTQQYQRRIDAYNTGGVYAYQRALLQDELEEKQLQLATLEEDKGDKTDEIAETKEAIAELEDEILTFASETLNSLYGIDLKNWTSQIGDALYDAWQQGEDGAKAFRDTVADIMGDVMSSILKVKVIQPAMEDLQTALFGEDGMSGYFGSDFQLDESEIKAIADKLMSVQDESEAYYEALDQLENYLNKNYGVSMKDSDNTGLTKGIQSVTEDTADLLASYINAIRADVSIQREYLRKTTEDYLPQFSILAEAQLRQLEMIATNTGRNADTADDILKILNDNISIGKGFKIA